MIYWRKEKKDKKKTNEDKSNYNSKILIKIQLNVLENGNNDMYPIQKYFANYIDIRTNIYRTKIRK